MRIFVRLMYVCDMSECMSNLSEFVRMCVTVRVRVSVCVIFVSDRVYLYLYV